MGSEGGSRKPSVAIVGSSSLIGRDLRELLEERAFPLSSLDLLETEEYAGLLQEFAGTIQVTQVISKDRLKGIDIAFLACSPEILRAFLDAGGQLPQTVIDLTAVTRAPSTVFGVSETRGLPAHGFYTSPHPVAILLSRVLHVLIQAGTVRSCSATILEPASAHGSSGVDRLQDETVQLLNFQDTEEESRRTLLAFNIRPEFEPDDVAATIERQVAEVLGATAPPLALTRLAVPVFHGYTIVLTVDLEGAVDATRLDSSFLATDGFVPERKRDRLTPVSAVGQDSIRVSGVRVKEGSSSFMLTAVADNLRLASANALRVAEALLFRAD